MWSPNSPGNAHLILSQIPYYSLHGPTWSGFVQFLCSHILWLFPCSLLAHSALATQTSAQTSDLEIGLPSAWKTPSQISTAILMLLSPSPQSWMLLFQCDCPWCPVENITCLLWHSLTSSSLFLFSFGSVLQVLFICLVCILPPWLEYELLKGRHICFSHSAPNTYTMIGI